MRWCYDNLIISHVIDRCIDDTKDDDGLFLFLYFFSKQLKVQHYIHESTLKHLFKRHVC